jgi:hypothetical protein
MCVVIPAVKSIVCKLCEELFVVAILASQPFF